MSELLDLAFSGANFVPNLLLLFCIGYWLIVAIGVLDVGSLDFDVDFDLEVDADVEVEIDMDGNPEANISWLNWILHFFNLGRIPFMVFLSFLALPMWVISMEANMFLENTTWWVGLIILIPTLIVSLFIAKFLTLPFVKIFQKLEDEPPTAGDAVGKVCTVLTKVSSQGIAQAEVNVDGIFLTLYIISR